MPQTDQEKAIHASKKFTANPPVWELAPLKILTDQEKNSVDVKQAIDLLEKKAKENELFLVGHTRKGNKLRVQARSEDLKDQVTRPALRELPPSQSQKIGVERVA